MLDTKTTPASGSYEFTGLAPGEYTVEFIPPEDHGFTVEDAGDDDTIDSDAKWETVLLSDVPGGEMDIDYVDAGVIAVTPPPDPDYSSPRVYLLTFNDIGISADPSRAASVTLSGTGPRYGQLAHWIDNDVDGQIEPPEMDVKVPAAYVRNTKPTVTARFKVKTPDGELPESVEIRGNGSNGIVFPVKTIDKNDADKYVYSGESTNPFENSVQHYDDFTIQWQVKVPGENWEDAGKTENDVYLTLAPPQVDPLFHTIVHIGSHYGAGATTSSAVITGVWNYFKGLGIKKQEETEYIGANRIPDIGLPLKYWQNYTAANGCGNAPVVLYTGHSTCGGMALVFADTMKAQGINPQDEIVSISDSIVVKNWTVKGPQIDTDDGPVDVIIFQPIEDSGDPNEMLDGKYGPGRDRYMLNEHTQLDDAAGIPGQNSPNPLANFQGHVWVRYVVNGQMRWLDPSYGVEYVGNNDNARLNDFEEKALYGLSQNGDIEDLELKMNKDLDGDGNITNDEGMSEDVIILQIPVKRQRTNIIDTNHGFEDH